MTGNNWNAGNFSLGVSYPPPTLADQGVPEPFPYEIQPYAEVSPNQVGGQVFLGRPVIKWSFGMLDQLQMGSLMKFISGGSQQVYLKTRVSWLSSAVYWTYQAQMQFPEKVNAKPGGLYSDVEFVFTDAVKISG